ncbi:hypothetical protein ACKWTF_006422 [Chironomus riparius]
MLRCEEEQIFYRVSIWRMNVYTHTMLNVYFFFVDNCCILPQYIHKRFSHKKEEKKKSAIEKVSHKLRLHNPLDIRNSIELTAHILNLHPQKKLCNVYHYI